MCPRDFDHRTDREIHDDQAECLRRADFLRLNASRTLDPDRRESYLIEARRHEEHAERLGRLLARQPLVVC